jgi:hypothetical protein
LNAENIGKLVEGAIDVIMAIVTNLPTIIIGLIEAIPTIIEAIFDPNDGFLSPDNIGALVDGCIEMITQLVIHLPEIIAGLIEAIPGIIDAIIDAASGIVDKMEQLGEQAAQAYQNGFNIFDPGRLPDGSNINDYVWDGTGTPPGGYRIGSGEYLPALARGGVVKRATKVMIGEDGAEAVVPLENNTGWIAKIAQQLNSMMPPLTININDPVVRSDDDIDRIAERVADVLSDNVLRSGMAYAR